MDAFLNSNSSKNIDLREGNPIRSDDKHMVITASEIRLSQNFVSKVICINKVSIMTWWKYWSHVKVVLVYCIIYLLHL